MDDVDESESAEDALGKPDQLATRLNRVHIGWLHTNFRLQLVPIVGIAFFLALGFLLGKNAPNIGQSVQASLSYMLGKFVAYFGCTAMAIWVGRTATRMHRSGNALTRFFVHLGILVLIYSTTVAMLTPPAGGGPQSVGWDILLSFLTAIPVTIGLSAVTLVAGIMEQPTDFGPTRFKLDRLYLNSFLLIGVPFLVFIFMEFFLESVFWPFKREMIDYVANPIKDAMDPILIQRHFISFGVAAVTFVLLGLQTFRTAVARQVRNEPSGILVILGVGMSVLVFITHSFFLALVLTLGPSISLAYFLPRHWLRAVVLFCFSFVVTQFVISWTWWDATRSPLLDLYGWTGIFWLMVIGSLTGRWLRRIQKYFQAKTASHV
ncbi:MAG: hypothetical protein WCV85_06035 [Patescibacteria group bacterium]